ncbi:aspartate carbamoyltransferase, chloroplastic [Silene latifolia]|uniref:aspartate carbamoyltransferase, chloroplastic n=1 Tax=Silene latifolia TaxID=37657 RepID=UPI003D784DB5
MKYKKSYKTKPHTKPLFIFKPPTSSLPVFLETTPFQTFFQGVNRLDFIVAMAVSSSINMYSGNGALGANVARAQKGVMSGCPELFSRKLVNFTRISSISNPNSLGFSFSAKPLRCESNGNALRKVGVPCHVVGTKNSSSFSVGQKFHLEDIIEAQQFDRETLSAIFEVAKQMEKVEKGSPGSEILKGYLMATLFYEPSTRTRLSFESAMKRLGGEVLTTENAREFSSAAKGETLEDSIRTVEGYSDIIVMRHFESGAAKRAAATAGIPVINAGDGPGQHPSQALLDVYTIEREIGKLDGITVALVGDLANGRTVRSLAYLLAKYNDVKIYFVAPEVVRMKDDIKDYLTSMNVKWEESADLKEVASKCDIVYQTRIQRERFGERVDLYEAARGKYIVDQEVLNVMPKHAKVMHPLPRLDEITVDVDDDPRAAYFRQAKNGLYIRMALLKLLLLGW